MAMTINVKRSPGVVFLLLAVVTAGILAWTIHSRPSGAQGQPEPARLEAMTTPAQTAMATPAPNEAGMPTEAAVEAASLDRLRISSQSWRRGGLGSNALVTFTLRNGNDFAVKDIEISCAFVRRDGSHLTDRKRLIPATVAMKSRKTFARMHIGFVNVNADKAKCALVSASRI
jgi:hypothetical protein